MKLNGLNLASYSVGDMEVDLWFQEDVAPSDVVVLKAPYVITNDDGDDEISRFDGYVFKSCEDEGELVHLKIILSVEPATEEAIKGLIANVDSLTKKVDSLEISSVPQLMSFARMAVTPMTVNMTNTEVASVSSFLSEWKVGAHYDKGESFTYQGKVYRAAQEIPSAQEIYKPSDEGVESLYTLIELANDGIRVWKHVTDATNSFALGEKCHYPDANGAIYVSKRDGNDSIPGADEWWVLQ